jgi:hypothetical protein
MNAPGHTFHPPGPESSNAPDDQSSRMYLSEVAASSGDKQAKAKLCSVQIDEVAVAFSPPA